MVPFKIHIVPSYVHQLWIHVDTLWHTIQNDFYSWSQTQNGIPFDNCCGFSCCCSSGLCAGFAGTCHSVLRSEEYHGLTHLEAAIGSKRNQWRNFFPRVMAYSPRASFVLRRDARNAMDSDVWRQQSAISVTKIVYLSHCPAFIVAHLQLHLSDFPCSMLSGGRNFFPRVMTCSARAKLEIMICRLGIPSIWLSVFFSLAIY